MQPIPAELGVVIGAITESQKLIDHALKSEEKGGQMYMCNALEELVNEGVQTGIQVHIKTCKKFNFDEKSTIDDIGKEFSISEEEAMAYVKKYW